jgi:hypothetical protein
VNLIHLNSGSNNLDFNPTAHSSSKFEKTLHDKSDGDLTKMLKDPNLNPSDRMAVLRELGNRAQDNMDPTQKKEYASLMKKFESGKFSECELDQLASMIGLKPSDLNKTEGDQTCDAPKNDCDNDCDDDRPQSHIRRSFSEICKELGNPNTSQDRRNALLTELAARNWDQLSSCDQKELKGLLDKLECGKKLTPDETAHMAKFLGISKDLVTGGGQEAPKDTPTTTSTTTPTDTSTTTPTDTSTTTPTDTSTTTPTDTSTTTPTDTSTTTPTTTSTAAAPAAVPDGGPVEKMSDAAIMGELSNKQITQDRRLALLNELEQRKAKSYPDGNSRYDLSALMTMMKEGRISGDDVRRLAQKLGISEDQIWRPALAQGGDELHAQVKGMSMDQLRQRLNDPNLTWEQRQVIVTQLKDLRVDKQKHDPVGMNRMQTLDKEFRSGHMSEKDQETYAAWLGIPVGDLYRRP